MIICAAIRVKKDNKFITIGCWRHGPGLHAVQKLTNGIPNKDMEQGFLDHHGNFLDRKQALSHATECGQLSATALAFKESRNETELYSEDLY